MKVIDKNLFYRILFMFCVSVVILSCDQGDLDTGGQDPGQDDIPKIELSHGPVTLQQLSVSATTAVFSGTIDMNLALLYTEFGIVYSADATQLQNSGTRVKIQSLINGKHFTETVSNLPHSSEMHFAPYYCTATGLFVVGETCRFKTSVPKMEIGIEESSKDRHSVNLLCELSGIIPVDRQFLTFGFLYSDDMNRICNNDGVYVGLEEIGTDGKAIVHIGNLSPDKTYYCRSYILQDSNYSFGEIREFILPDPYHEAEKSLNMSDAINLSRSGTANCYIVSESGLYKFKVVKGNSNTSVGDVVSGTILWETFGTSAVPQPCDLIDGICYRDGYMAFRTADTFREGNAVVVAKDVSGNILWSWHIWLTDEPRGQVYYNNAGTMMDRNLGATSADPGDVGALGLRYQWGRKDPFPGSSSISDDIKAESTIIWPVTQSDSKTGTIEYATANPTTLIGSNNKNYDWYYTGYASTDNTRWTESSRAKSIYDPCPVGWRVPDGGGSGVWAAAVGSSGSFTGCSYDGVNEGMNFSGKFGDDYVIWYPATGFRNSIDGFRRSHYWSSSPDASFGAYALYFENSDDSVSLSARFIRELCFAVRCIQE